MASRDDKILTSLDKLTGLYEKLHQEYILLNAAVKRIENDILPRIESDISNLKADVGNLKADVGSLKADVGSLKAGVGRVEQKLDEHMRQPAHA